MRIEPGRFYSLGDDGAIEIQPAPADVWVCRRLADFVDSQLPDGAVSGCCENCGTPIAFNPQREFSKRADSPVKVCMQCASIEPLPIP